MAIYRAEIKVDDIETYPILNTKLLKVSAGDGALNTSLDGKQIMPCVSMGHKYNYLSELTDLLTIIDLSMCTHSSVNFIPTNNLIPRPENNVIKPAFVRGVANILRYDVVG